MIKPVFGVSDKRSYKPVSLATDTYRKFKFLPVASFRITIEKRITKALIGLGGCAGWSALVLFVTPRRQFFLRRAHILKTKSNLAPWNWFKPSCKIIYWPFQGGTSFVDLLCFFCLLFAMPLCMSVYMCLVVTCWERAELLALVCSV